MATKNMDKRLTDVLHDDDEDYSREAITLAAGTKIFNMGAVLGKITKAAGAVVAAAGNVGDGAVTGFVLFALAELGDYVVRCVAASANGGTFAVFAPDGSRLADATVGAACSNPQIGFAINDGATDFAPGDAFTLSVVAGSGKYVDYDGAAINGSHDSLAVLIENGVDTTDGDQVAVAVVRGPAIVKESGLVWADGQTADQKTAGKARLAAAGILTRTDI